MFNFTRTWLPILMALCGPLVAYEMSAEVGVGYRQDKLSWSLGGPGGHPSTLSKLTWSNVRSIDWQGKVEVSFCEKYMLRVEGNYGHIYQGHNSDKDYTVNHRTTEDILFLESHANAGKGTVWDLSVGGSWWKFCLYDCLEITPLVGYAEHQQRLHLYDGEIVVDLFDPQNVGFKFPELNSRYTANWSGPWVGVDLTYNRDSRWTFSTTQEIHALYYYAKGHWNLREDFIGDFHHRGWGWGYFTKVAVECEVSCGWLLGAQIKYNYCRMYNGHDKTKFITSNPFDPLEVVEGSTRIKHTIWTSCACLVTLGYIF